MDDEIVYSESDLRRLFDTFDLDKDGRINRGEFRNLLLHVDADADQHDTDLAYTVIDQDGNGTVSFDEFSDWWQNR